MENFGERLSKLLKLYNLSKNKVGRDVNLHPTTIANYINNVTKPDQKIIKMLADYFLINEHWLATGEGDMGYKEVNEKQLSFLKNNIRKFLKFKNVSKYKFYKDTGISSGTFGNSAGLSEEFLLIFINYFDDININWLMTGQGDMVIPKKEGLKTLLLGEPTQSVDLYQFESLKAVNEDLKAEILKMKEELQFKNERINDLNFKINSRNEHIDMLREKIELFKTKLSIEIDEKKLLDDIKKID